MAYKRSGSALHRFHSARQSNGGFSAVSPNLLSFMMVTIDNMAELGDRNHDLMFQSSMLYAKLLSLEISPRAKKYPCDHHFHVSCLGCIREVLDINLDLGTVDSSPDRSLMLTWMNVGLTDWSRITKYISILHFGKRLDISNAWRTILPDGGCPRTIVWVFALKTEFRNLEWRIISHFYVGKSYA